MHNSNNDKLIHRDFIAHKLVKFNSMYNIICRIYMYVCKYVVCKCRSNNIINIIILH